MIPPSEALAGVRVLDLSGNLAGPYCGQILADLGARVIKVERPGEGDPARRWAPPAWGGDGTLFLAANRGKEGLALELGTEQGSPVLARLLDWADVVLQSFRPDVARRFGLTEEALRPRYPKLILCSLTAFDPQGSRGERPGYDPLVQAHAGLISVTGPRDGQPARVGTSIIDMAAGMWAALGIMAALRSRDVAGEGIEVRVSLEDTGLAWGAYHLMGVEASGEVPGPMGSGLGMIVPYSAFPTRDETLLMIATGTDAIFRRLCQVLELGDVAADPRFGTNAQRVEHREEVEARIAKATRAFRRSELEKRLVASGVPCAPVRDMGEVAADPEVRAGAFRLEPHPRIPGYRAVALPPTWGGHRSPPSGAPPRIGEHTRAILSEIGFSEAEVGELEAAGVVASVPPSPE